MHEGRMTKRQHVTTWDENVLSFSMGRDQFARHWGIPGDMGLTSKVKNCLKLNIDYTNKKNHINCRGTS